VRLLRAVEVVRTVRRWAVVASCSAQSRISGESVTAGALRVTGTNLPQDSFFIVLMEVILSVPALTDADASTIALAQDS
jgi:hypothetical protein